MSYFSLSFKKKCIYLPMAVPGPHCCKQAFSSCSEHDLLFTGCVGFSSQSMDSKARTSVVVGH